METHMETLLLVPVDDSVVFPNMTITLAIDVGDEERVVLVPRKGDEFASVGTVANVLERLRLPGGGRAVAIEGVHRARIGAARTDATGALRVEVEPHPDDVPVDGRTRNLEREYRAVVEEILELRGDDGRVAAFVRSITEPGALADTSGYAPDLSYEQKVELLETIDVTDRLELALKMQRERLTELQVRARIRDDVQSGAEKQQREYFLRKQMESIRRELGDDDASVVEEYRTKIDEAGMPDDVREQAEREVLDADHAGLGDVKDRIVEYLAVRKLRQERGIEADKRSGAILTLIGPPGTGKTSIGESVARAMNREFVRMSLGGVRDEAEIRGHRRTYIGALPGRLVRALRDAGTMNPVIMLDEVDKVGADWRGDPSAALREDEVSISDELLGTVVSEYTREAGVRNLERELGTILRKTATKIASGKAEAPVAIDLDAVRDALGRQKVFQEAALRTAAPGVATGLSVTGAGGDVLFIEATSMEGKD